MLELPETITIAQQMNCEVRGKRIATCVAGFSPHRYTAWNMPPEQVMQTLSVREVGSAREQGGFVVVSITPDFALAIGGHARIVFHRSAVTILAQHQLLLQFHDGTLLTVSIMRHGSIYVMSSVATATSVLLSGHAVSPLSPAFNLAYWRGLISRMQPNDHTPSAQFITLNTGIRGVGHGYAPDILYRARILPRRRVQDLSASEHDALYQAMHATLTKAVAQGGRDTERDLYNLPGGYHSIMGQTGSTLCRKCSAPLQKALLAGVVYLVCPHCQS
jgi:formamidopyrimidine-DNA glycosylase